MSDEKVSKQGPEKDLEDKIRLLVKEFVITDGKTNISKALVVLEVIKKTHNNVVDAIKVNVDSLKI